MATQLEPKQQSIPQSAIKDMGFHSGPAFGLLRAAADFISKSDIIPKQFQGNLPNCAVALNMAQRMGADPMMLMQNLDVIYGRPSFRAKFKIATCNQTGDFTKLKFEWKGKNGDVNDPEWGCRAYCTEKATGEIVYGPWVDMKMVRAEGWWDRKDREGKPCSKWRTIPELMFMYRAGSYFVDTHCPEITMGLRSAEEEEEVEGARNVTTQGSVLEKTVNFPPAYPGPVSDQNPEPEKTQNAPAEKSEVKATEKPQAAPKSESKQTAGRKSNQATAATAQGNPSYSDSEPDPFTTGELSFNREPGSDDQ